MDPINSSPVALDPSQVAVCGAFRSHPSLAPQIHLARWLLAIHHGKPPRNVVGIDGSLPSEALEMTLTLPPLAQFFVPRKTRDSHNT